MYAILSVKTFASLPTNALLLAFALCVSGCVNMASSNPHYDAQKKHHTPEGFKNNYPHDPPGDFWKWQAERWRAGGVKKPERGWDIASVAQPEIDFLKSNRSARAVTWLGHASLLVQTNGVNVLTDPAFSDRASPVQFGGPKREIPLAIPSAQLPPIDIVFISHNHYDHLDVQSIRGLDAQAGSPPMYVVPIGLKQWFVNLGVRGEVRTLDWWDSMTHKGLTLHFTPAQHWSKRTLWDANRSLWGGLVVEDRGWKFFYSGDTGYSQDFKDIGAKFGGFDLAAIPIGAYAPRWFMKTQHCDPAEAVQIMLDVKAKEAVGVHWGTFILTDEALDEPPKLLKTALTALNVPSAQFQAWAHGETRRY